MSLVAPSEQDRTLALRYFCFTLRPSYSLASLSCSSSSSCRCAPPNAQRPSTLRHRAFRLPACVSPGPQPRPPPALACLHHNNIYCRRHYHHLHLLLLHLVLPTRYLAFLLFLPRSLTSPTFYSLDLYRPLPSRPLPSPLSSRPRARSLPSPPLPSPLTSSSSSLQCSLTAPAADDVIWRQNLRRRCSGRGRGRGRRRGRSGGGRDEDEDEDEQTLKRYRRRSEESEDEEGKQAEATKAMHDEPYTLKPLPC